MKNINDNVFLYKISERIKNGDFDNYLTLPFQSRELFLAAIKNRLSKKPSTSMQILSDAEIKTCLHEIKETALIIIALYLKLGFMIKTDTGYEFTDKYRLAVKVAYRYND